jgi:hypothetical protein
MGCARCRVAVVSRRAPRPPEVTHDQLTQARETLCWICCKPLHRLSTGDLSYVAYWVEHHPARAHTYCANRETRVGHYDKVIQREAMMRQKALEL